MFTCVHLRVFTSTRARNPGRSNASGSSVVDLGGTGREREREREREEATRGLSNERSSGFLAPTIQVSRASGPTYAAKEKRSATNVR